MASWLTQNSSVGPQWISCGSRARCVRWTDTPSLSPPARLPVRDRSRARALRQEAPMTSTLLDPAFLGPAADHPAGSVRRTGAAGLAAALAAVADRWLDLVEYRA